MKKTEGFVAIEQGIDAPASVVVAYIRDFRNAKEWMVGVDGVEHLDEDSYRLMLESPVGRLEPEVRILENDHGVIRWVYTSTIEGGGDNMTITYSTGGAGGGSSVLLSQPGRLAGFAGGHGDGQLVEYLAPAPAGAGREAWLLGGGENAEVVYGRRR